MATLPKDNPIVVDSLEVLPPEISLEEEVEQRVRTRTISLMERAGGDPAAIERELNNREMILERARKTTIHRSRPIDWTLFKGEVGSVVGVPRDSLLVNAKKVFSINIFNYRPKGPNGPEPQVVKTDEVIMERDGQGWKPKHDHAGHEIAIYTATMWADAMCGLTGEPLLDSRFTARTGRFAGTETYQSDLIQSCRTGLDSMIVRKLTGLRKVSAEDLTSEGIVLEKCYQGSGYGSSGERGASKVAEEGVEAGRAKLLEELTKRTGADKDAIRKLTVDITSDPSKGFKGFDSVNRITQAWQLEKAWAKLKAHPIFGDKGNGGGKKAGAPEAGLPFDRQPGEDREE